MIEVLRDSVQTWECDQMGHLNVQFYVERAQAGAIAFEALLRRAEHRPDLPLRLVELHIRFHRELRPGSAVVLRGGFIESQERAGDVALCFELIRLTSAEPVLSASFTLDLETPAQGALPDSWRKVIEESLVDLPETAALRGLKAHPPRPSADLADADALGLLPIQRGPVLPGECGTSGALSAAAVMGRLSAGIPHLILGLGGGDRSEAEMGGAALEYRFRFRRTAGPGTGVVVRSGLADVNAKTRTFVHWILDTDSGEAIATAEAVAVSLDLRARRLASLSDEAVAVYRRKVVPGLSF